MQLKLVQERFSVFDSDTFRMVICWENRTKVCNDLQNFSTSRFKRHLFESISTFIADSIERASNTILLVRLWCVGNFRSGICASSTRVERVYTGNVIGKTLLNWVSLLLRVILWLLAGIFLLVITLMVIVALYRIICTCTVCTYTYTRYTAYRTLDLVYT